MFESPEQLSAGDERLRRDTTRLWISDLQWLALLARLQERQEPYHGDNRRGETPARERFAINATYILHLDISTEPRTYVVRARNLSARGMGFIHDEPLPEGAPCTVVLTDQSGSSRIAAGRVAWQHRLDERLYDTGIEFHEPIDVLRFLEAD